MLVLIYVWVDSNNDIKTKTRVLENLHDDSDDLYNGVASNEHNETDVVLKAKKVVKNPFMNDSYILLCDTWIYNDNTLSQHFSNKRQHCHDYLEIHKDINTSFEFFQTSAQTYFWTRVRKQNRCFEPTLTQKNNSRIY